MNLNHDDNDLSCYAVGKIEKAKIDEFIAKIGRKSDLYINDLHFVLRFHVVLLNGNIWQGFFGSINQPSIYLKIKAMTGVDLI